VRCWWPCPWAVVYPRPGGDNPPAIFGQKLDKENLKRTGLKAGSLLDVHIITDEDIKKKDSWATHITSPYMSVKKIPLKKNKS